MKKDIDKEFRWVDRIDPFKLFTGWFAMVAGVMLMMFACVAWVIIELVSWVTAK